MRPMGIHFDIPAEVLSGELREIRWAACGYHLELVFAVNLKSKSIHV